MFTFHTSGKHQTIKVKVMNKKEGFLMFSEGMKLEHLPEMV